MLLPAASSLGACIPNELTLAVRESRLAARESGPSAPHPSASSSGSVSTCEVESPSGAWEGYSASPITLLEAPSMAARSRVGATAVGLNAMPHMADATPANSVRHMAGSLPWWELW